MESITLTYGEFVQHKYFVYQIIDLKKSKEKQINDIKDLFHRRFKVNPDVVWVGPIRDKEGILIPENYVYIQLDR